MYDISQVVNYRRFRQCVVGNAPLETLHTGMRWAEGPVWFADSGCLLLRDVPSNRILRWVEGQEASVYREPSNHANGNTRDRQGRLLTCESGGRRVVRTELDGRQTVLADRYLGTRLNSPNDIVVKGRSVVHGVEVVERLKSSTKRECQWTQERGEGPSPDAGTVLVSLDETGLRKPGRLTARALPDVL